MGRRWSFIGLEEGDEFGGEAERAGLPVPELGEVWGLDKYINSA